jgi:hypothetical protein
MAIHDVGHVAFDCPDIVVARNDHSFIGSTRSPQHNRDAPPELAFRRFRRDSRVPRAAHPHVTYLVPQTLLFIPFADIIRDFRLGDTPWASILTYIRNARPRADMQLSANSGRLGAVVEGPTWGRKRPSRRGTKRQISTAGAMFPQPVVLPHRVSIHRCIY